MQQKIFYFLYIDNNIYTKSYKLLIIFSIILSIIPLMFKEQTPLFLVIDIYIIFIFVLDYILHLIAAKPLLNKGNKSYIIYAKTPMAIIDLISILSSVSILFDSVNFFRVIKLLRTLRFVRFIKLFKYSKGIKKILNIFIKQKEALSIVGNITLIYTLLCSIIIFTVEPELFNDFFDALYFMMITITTIGYGDIVPKSVIGRFIVMFTSIISVMIIALPAAIFTAGYMEDKSNKKE